MTATPVTEGAPDEKLDRQFWLVVAGLAALSVVADLAIALWNIDDSLFEATEGAVQLDTLFKLVLCCAAPIFIFVAGFVGYFAWRYRRRSDEARDAVGTAIAGNARLELVWFLTPAVLLLVLAGLATASVGGYYGARPSLTFEGIAHNWYYEFRYPGLARSIRDDLHVPLGTEVTLYLTASEADPHDALLHSFWVPEFRLKQDMVPGSLVPVHFVATRAGAYPIVCAVFCGVGHPLMRGRVIVETPDDYRRWLAAERAL